MHKTIEKETYTFITLFFIILSYYTATNLLKIDNTFYTNCIQLLKNNFVLIKESPFFYLFFGYFIYLSQFLTNFLEVKGVQLIFFFNLFGSALITFNLFFIRNFFKNGKKKISDYFFVLLFLGLNRNYEKIILINLANLQFMMFNLLLYFRKKMIFYAIFICSSMLGVFVFMTDFLFDFYNFYKIYQKNLRKYKIERVRKLVRLFSYTVFSFIFYSFSYLFIFYVLFSVMKNNSIDSKEMSLEFKSAIQPMNEKCDKYVLDRALVTLINQKSQSIINFDKKITGKPIKNENSIFQVIKIHVENENYNPKNENNFFIQNKDYVKLVHYKTKKYLRSEVPKESKGKFFSLELKNTEENTDDNDFFQIFFDGEYLQSRNTVFTLKHVTSGKELGVKLDKQTVSISSESNISTRKFYIEDCFNDQYFKDNLKNEKVKEKTLFYPNLSFFDRFIEYHQKKENFKFNFYQKESIILLIIAFLIILNDLFGLFNQCLCFNKEVIKCFIYNLVVLFCVTFYETNIIFCEFMILKLVYKMMDKVKESKKGFFVCVWLAISYKLK